MNLDTGICDMENSVCNGGENNGQSCSSDDDCPGSYNYEGDHGNYEMTIKVSDLDSGDNGESSLSFSLNAYYF